MSENNSLKNLIPSFEETTKRTEENQTLPYFMSRIGRAIDDASRNGFYRVVIDDFATSTRNQYEAAKLLRELGYTVDIIDKKIYHYGDINAMVVRWNPPIPTPSYDGW